MLILNTVPTLHRLYPRHKLLGGIVNMPAVKYFNSLYSDVANLAKCSIFVHLGPTSLQLTLRKGPATGVDL